MNWFERLTGFPETNYEDTRRQLQVHGQQLRSLANGRSYGIGEFELVSLQSLRQRVQLLQGGCGTLRVNLVSGNVGYLHQSKDFAGALFQVASQFNMLEMTSPSVTPEDGVARYADDPTQGPACAIAAGAATIFRNYFVPMDSGVGQTRSRQLDGLADVGAALSIALGRRVGALWTMRNGYAMCSLEGLQAISEHLGAISIEEVDALRGKLRIGLHKGVEVTTGEVVPRPRVSQAFCSALPVSYCSPRHEHWAAFSTLVLEAAYEATLWSAVETARQGGSNIALLTSLGGGAFGNHPDWIHSAMRRALTLVENFDLDVRLVSRGSPPRAFAELAKRYG